MRNTDSGVALMPRQAPRRTVNLQRPNGAEEENGRGTCEHDGSLSVRRLRRVLGVSAGQPPPPQARPSPVLE